MQFIAVKFIPKYCNRVKPYPYLYLSIIKGASSLINNSISEKPEDGHVLRELQGKEV
jgi:hypothetical protein